MTPRSHSAPTHPNAYEALGGLLNALALRPRFVETLSVRHEQRATVDRIIAGVPSAQWESMLMFLLIEAVEPGVPGSVIHEQCSEEAGQRRRFDLFMNAIKGRPTKGDRSRKDAETRRCAALDALLPLEREVLARLVHMASSVSIRIDAWNNYASFLNLDTRPQPKRSRASVGWWRFVVIDGAVRWGAWLCLNDRQPVEFEPLVLERHAFASLLRRVMAEHHATVRRASHGDETFARSIKRWRAGIKPRPAALPKLVRAITSDPAAGPRLLWALRWALAFDNARAVVRRHMGTATARSWQQGFLDLASYVHSLLQAGVRAHRFNRAEAWHTLALGAWDGLGRRLLLRAAEASRNADFREDAFALVMEPRRGALFWQNRIRYWANTDSARFALPSLDLPSTAASRWFWSRSGIAYAAAHRKHGGRRVVVPTVDLTWELREAERLMVREEWAKAARLFESWIATHPPNGIVLDQLANCHLRLGNRKRAHDLAKKADRLGWGSTLFDLRATQVMGAR